MRATRQRVEPRLRGYGRMEGGEKRDSPSPRQDEVFFPLFLWEPNNLRVSLLFNLFPEKSIAFLFSRRLRQLRHFHLNIDQSLPVTE